MFQSFLYHFRRFKFICSAIFLIPILIWCAFILLGTTAPSVTILLMLVLFLICMITASYIIKEMHSTFVLRDRHSFTIGTVFRSGYLFCSQCCPTVRGFPSVTRYAIGCGLLLWYLTLLLPVNIENKVTVPETLFYHGILLVYLVLLVELREARRSSVINLEADNDGTVGPGSASTIYRMRPSEGLPSSSSTIQPPGRYCILLDCLIDSNNQWRYISWLLVHLLFVYYTTNLALTSVCTPTMYLDWFILPRDCSSVYDDFGRSWVFVAALYGLLGSLVFVSLLVYELFLLANKPAHTVRASLVDHAYAVRIL